VVDLTPPVTHVTAVNSSTPTFVVSYAGSDAGSGLDHILIFVQVDGGAPHQIALVTDTSGTVDDTVPVDGQSHTYRFYSQGIDHANNLQPAPTDPSADVVVTAAFNPPDTTAPVTHVTGVDSSTPTFVVNYSSSDAGGSGLASTTLFVQVDGGTAQPVATVTAASGTVDYAAIVDGQSHTYRFYSAGTDGAGNVQATPTDPTADVVVSASFSRASSNNATNNTTSQSVPLQSSGIVVQHGAAERSYIRYVDLLFNESDGLDSLIAGNHIHLIKHSLTGTGATPISLDGLLHVVDQAIEIDFGTLGLGGNPSSSAGDGYYEIDIDGFSEPYFFTRLLGDVNGDGVVNQADVNLVKGSLGRTGTGLQGDVNGDGTVTKTDLALTRRALGHKLSLGHNSKHGPKR
jgi:hypothetical protein